MIKYKLKCKDCNNIFDSWFASSKDYEKLKKLKHLNCYNCNSLKVDKTLMSPNILGAKKDNINLNNKKISKIKNKIKEYQTFIKKNFKFVGDNFANKARLLKYDKKDKNEGIYGTATFKEIKELKEEGIEAETIPWFEDKEN
tara:strand:+ start:479 stop:904 length:426 start_codon:yes stop_codon:yes gene_type:complete